jgi:hypothetical protein
MRTHAPFDGLFRISELMFPIDRYKGHDSLSPAKTVSAVESDARITGIKAAPGGRVAWNGKLF